MTSGLVIRSLSPGLKNSGTFKMLLPECYVAALLGR